MKHFLAVLINFSSGGTSFYRKIIKQMLQNNTKKNVCTLDHHSDDISVLKQDVIPPQNELKSAEYALRLSEEKFSKAFHASPNPISITTLTGGRYIEVNESYCSQIGYSSKELIGHYSHEINLFPDPEERERMTMMLSMYGYLRNYPVNYYTKVFGIRKCLVSAEVIELQGERCMLAVIDDITDKIRMESEILKISERERIRIGQDLHDDLGQHLIGIEAMSMHLYNCLNGKLKDESLLAKKINLLIRQATDKTRRLSKGLYPIIIEKKGLILALKDLAASTRKIFRIKCVIEFEESFHINDTTIAMHMYHIAQESVTNSVKHGKATFIRIELKSDMNNVYMNITDNGCGFSVDSIKSSGSGLRIMQYRARIIGGVLDFMCTEKKGAAINLRIPRVHVDCSDEEDYHE